LQQFLKLPLGKTFNKFINLLNAEDELPRPATPCLLAMVVALCTGIISKTCSVFEREGNLLQNDILYFAIRLQVNHQESHWKVRIYIGKKTGLPVKG